MAANLDSAWAKWRRASEYAKTITAELAGPDPSAPWAYDYPVTAEAQVGGLEYRFYVDPLPFDREGYALRIGEFLFNLRCALDHMVWALHGLIGVGISDHDAKRIQFPIYSSQPRYRNGPKRGKLKPSSDWDAIRALPANQRDEIDLLQPYKRRDDGLGDTRMHLKMLAALNNIDKHRYLHVVNASNMLVQMPSNWPDEYGFRCIPRFGRPLKGKTEVFRWTFKVRPPDVAEQIGRYNYVTGGITLDESNGEPMLLPYFDEFVDVVESVLRRFEPFFS